MTGHIGPIRYRSCAPPDPFPRRRGEGEIRTDLAIQLTQLIDRWHAQLAADRERLSREP